MTVIRYPDVCPMRISWELRSLTGRFSSPISGTIQTLGRPGSVWAVTMIWDHLVPSDAGKMKAFLSACRGGSNRFYLRDWAYVQRGNFAATQIVDDPELTSTAGWTNVNSAQGVSIQSVDGLIRLRSNNRTTDLAIRTPALSPDVGLPYIARAMSFSIENIHGVRRRSIPFVIAAGSAYLEISQEITAVGSEVFAQHLSCSRCVIIDIRENLLLRSEDFSHAIWTKTRTTVTANAAEFGNETAGDALVEDGSSNSHFISQSIVKTAFEELATFSIFVKRGAGTRNIRLQMVGASASDEVQAGFDIGAGTVSVAATQSGNFSQPRATITAVPAANDTGWYRLTVSAITDTSTNITCNVYLLSGTTLSYAGNSTSSMYLFGAQLQRSMLAGRYATTTAAIVDGDSLDVPMSLYVKGFPANTDGLLLPGDFVEAILRPNDDDANYEFSNLGRVVFPVGSDAYGIAQIHIEPQPRIAPDITVRNDGTGHRLEPCVMLYRPEGRFMLDTNSIQWDEDANLLPALQFTAVEDIVP